MDQCESDRDQPRSDLRWETQPSNMAHKSRANYIVQSKHSHVTQRHNLASCTKVCRIHGVEVWLVNRQIKALLHAEIFDSSVSSQDSVFVFYGQLITACCTFQLPYRKQEGGGEGMRIQIQISTSSECNYTPADGYLKTERDRTTYIPWSIPPSADVRTAVITHQCPEGQISIFRDAPRRGS